jgi:hypothetical protein
VEPYPNDNNNYKTYAPFNKSSVRIVIYIIVMWIPFNKTSVRIVKSIIVLWTLFHETSVYNHSHRGFVEPYPNDNNNYKTYVINKLIPLCEAFGHTVKYTGFVGCDVLAWEVQP